jgi:hypothetical protein
MLGDGKIFSYLQNVPEVSNLKVNVMNYIHQDRWHLFFVCLRVTYVHIYYSIVIGIIIIIIIILFR